jgi:hypothetical protein
MAFISRLRVLPPDAWPSRLADPGRRGALRLLAWIAAALLAALLAWQAFTHPLSDLSAYGCWSVPDDASACNLGRATILQDQLVELAASVLPEHDGRAVLAQQTLGPRWSGTVVHADRDP